MWRAKLRRWLPYVVDQHLIHQALITHGKGEPVPWPVEKPPAAGDQPASVKAGISHLKAFSQRIAALRKPRR